MDSLPLHSTSTPRPHPPRKPTFRICIIGVGGELAGSEAPVDSVHLSHTHLTPPASPLPPTNPPCPTLPAIERFPRCWWYSAPGPPTTHLVYPHEPYRQPYHHRRLTPARATHPHMAGRSLPPPRARATYLTCVVRHTSSSSVGWIAAHVVHVAAADREWGVQRVCARLSALAVGLAEVNACSGTAFLRAAGCSIRLQCSQRHCFTAMDAAREPRWQKDRGVVTLPDRTAAQSTYAVCIMITHNTL